MSTDLAAQWVTLAELDRLLRAADRRVLLVSSRLLRRIIRRERDVPGLGLVVPHRRAFVIARDCFLAIVDGRGFVLSEEQEAASHLILIASPDETELARTSAVVVLQRYSRLLFHAAIHSLLDERYSPGPETIALLRSRAAIVGDAAWAEIRDVLRKEDYLLPPADDREVYIEFAAVYLEFRYWAPSLIDCFFPAIADHQKAVDDLLAADIDAARLFEATRLPGARDSTVRGMASDSDDGFMTPEMRAATWPSRPDARKFRHYKKAAKVASEAGNTVRAAICWRRAVDAAPPKRVEECRAGMRAELERLGDRLCQAVNLETATRAAWRKALAPLLRPASVGFWPVEARLLYDLQRACLDAEQDLYSVDLVEWALALGRRPLRFPVPARQLVMKLRHLRRAIRRLGGARLVPRDRTALAGLLHAAQHHTEGELRTSFRPQIESTLQSVGFTPTNWPEQAARHKLTEELLDRIGESGYLTLGQLRDAVSRNDLKMPDLGLASDADAALTPSSLSQRLVRGGGDLWRMGAELVRGDRLIRADHGLARKLNGVYRRGEVYLRGLQRASSLAFATMVGRFLTLYIALPFGIAFVALEGLQHIIEPIAKLMDHHVELLAPFIVLPVHSPLTPKVRPLEVSIPFLILGVFLLGVLHVVSFRRTLLQALLLGGRGLRALLMDWPKRVLEWPWVRAFVDNRLIGAALRYAAKPLAIAALSGLGLRAAGIDGPAAWAGAAAVFFGSGLLLNSRIGQDLEEFITDLALRACLRLQFSLIPAVFRFILAFFRRILEGMDRWLYRVDEWLRFHRKRSGPSVVIKPVLGILWFAITYVVRIYVNLLVEPTINPIKHFPVVTVAAKLILPFSIILTRQVADPLTPLLGRWAARGCAALTVFFLPGLFGFLVWEFKENWRLYAANRPRRLQPTLIGHHGETMTRLLRPGFHSGTIPKLFAKWRRAEAATLEGHSPKAAHTNHEVLGHLAERLRHFVEREALFLLNETVAHDRFVVEDVRLATNQVNVTIGSLNETRRNWDVSFREMPAGIVAAVHGPESSSCPSSAESLRLALHGLFMRASVSDVVKDERDNHASWTPLTWTEWIAAWDAIGARDGAGPCMSPEFIIASGIQAP